MSLASSVLRRVRWYTVPTYRQRGLGSQHTSHGSVFRKHISNAALAITQSRRLFTNGNTPNTSASMRPARRKASLKLDGQSSIFTSQNLFKNVQCRPYSSKSDMLLLPGQTVNPVQAFVMNNKKLVGALVGVGATLFVLGAGTALKIIGGIVGVAAVGAAGYFGIVYLQKRKSNRIVQIAKDLLTDNRHKIVKLVGEFEVPTSRSKFAVTQFQEDTPIGKRDALVIVIMLEGAYGAGIAQIKAVQKTLGGATSTYQVKQWFKEAGINALHKLGKPKPTKQTHVVTGDDRYEIVKFTIDMNDMKKMNAERLEIVNIAESFTYYDLETKRMVTEDETDVMAGKSLIQNETHQ